MVGETRWSKYGPCDECDADAEKPCIDLRYVARTGRFAVTRPHPGRHVKGWLPRQTEEANRGR